MGLRKVGWWLFGVFVALLFISLIGGMIQAVLWLSNLFGSSIIFWIILIIICSLVGALVALLYGEKSEEKESEK